MRLIFSFSICIVKFGFAANTTNYHDQLIYKLYSVGIVWWGATGDIKQGNDGATSQIRRSRVLRPGARSLARLNFIPPPKPSQRITDGTQTALHTLRMIVGLSKENKGRSSRCRPLHDAIRVMTRKGCKVSRSHSRLPRVQRRLVVQAHLRVALWSVTHMSEVVCRWPQYHQLRPTAP
jgi:hypothetical protein